MKKYIGILAIALSACVNTSDGLYWLTDFDKAVSQAKAQNKVVMVDIYTDWCGWCKKLDRDVYTNADVQRKLAKSFVAVKINPEKSQQGMELARKFGTQGFPHIVFVDGNGNKVSEIGGYLPADDFASHLDNISKGAKS